MLPGALLDLLFWALLILPFQMLATYVEGILQGIQQVAKITILNLSRALLSLVLVALLLAFLHCGLTGALIAHAMAIVAGVALSPVYLRRERIAIPATPHDNSRDGGVPINMAPLIRAASISERSYLLSGAGLVSAS